MAFVAHAGSNRKLPGHDANIKRGSCANTNVVHDSSVKCFAVRAHQPLHRQFAHIATCCSLRLSKHLNAVEPACIEDVICGIPPR